MLSGRYARLQRDQYNRRRTNRHGERRGVSAEKGRMESIRSRVPGWLRYHRPRAQGSWQVVRLWVVRRRAVTAAEPGANLAKRGVPNTHGFANG